MVYRRGVAENLAQQLRQGLRVLGKGLAVLVDSINGAATVDEKIRTLKLLVSTRAAFMQINKLMNNGVKKLNVISGLIFSKHAILNFYKCEKIT